MALGLSLGCSHTPRPEAHTPAYQHRFDGAAHWAQIFDGPERDAWQHPDLVVSALQLPRDAHVADVGSGTGYFAVRLAAVVPEGRVWGCDIEADMVRWLNDRARREHLRNLFSVLATPDDPMLPEPVDLVLVVDTYHHIADRTTYFGHLRSSLRPGGRVAIVDFRMDSPEGPPLHARVPPDEVRRDMESAGYTLDHAVDGLPRQYMLLFRAP